MCEYKEKDSKDDDDNAKNQSSRQLLVDSSKNDDELFEKYIKTIMNEYHANEMMIDPNCLKRIEL